MNTPTNCSRLLTAFAITIALTASFHLAGAATTIVTVGQGGTNYNPSSVTIQVGDTVRWTWAGNNHSATSGTPGNPNGIFDSGIHNSGFTYSFTFTSAGTFP